MKFPLYWVDAFASRVFEGNPAAVVPLSNWISDALMQRIAFENGLSETAFVVQNSATHFGLRWFAPKSEVDLCGHATLAAAFTIYTQLAKVNDPLSFDSRSGVLKVARQGDRYELDFPIRPSAAEAEVPTELLKSLNIAPKEIQRTQGQSRYLARYDQPEQVRRLCPDFERLRQMGDDVRLIATAPGADCDFVSRFFAPGIGVPEDPVTGSAHCTLVPYWAQRLGKSALHARQLSARGGELWCNLRGDRVGLAGHAVLYLRGEIEI